MVSVALKGFLGIAVVVAIAAYVARPRFPDTASNHGLKTVTGLVIKTTWFLSHVGSMMGFSSINITRGILDTLSVPPTQYESIEIYETTMDGVEVIVFQPAGKSDVLLPGVIYYHGGGWVTLSPVEYKALCQEIVYQTQSVVVSVNYRRAPEYRYPIPLEDCLTATRYLLNNAEKYGVDKYNVGVKGDSAGGNLAMAAALKLSKESGLPKLKFMSLDYPALQTFDFDLPCYQLYAEGPGFLDKKIMVRYWLLYAFGQNMTYYDLLHDNSQALKAVVDAKFSDYVNPWLLPNDIPGVEDHEPSDTMKVSIPKELTDMITDPLYSPLMASDDDLTLLPKTYVFNAEFDVLRDDGFILVARMKQLGLDVTHSYLSTEEHGFLSLLVADPTVANEVTRFAKFFNTTITRN